MTIYVLELTPQALDGLPSVRSRFHLCKIIGLHILEHLRVEALDSHPGSSRELGGMKTTFLWCLDFLEGTSTDDPSVVDPLMTVLNLYVRKAATAVYPRVAVGFTLEDMSYVSSDILILTLAELIRISLVGIKDPPPRPGAFTEDRLTALKLIPRRLAGLYAIRSRGRYCLYRIRLQVEFQDLNGTIYILAD